MKIEHAICISVLAALSGCADLTPNLDARFGEAVTRARLAQTVDPQAAQRPPAPGMDGRAAKEAMDHYVDSFKSPPPTINVINIGGAFGGGQ